MERLDDHRREVRTRVDERKAVQQELSITVIDERAVKGFVEHLVTEFDPGTCSSCSLFNFCRNELRCSPDPTANLVELGIRPEIRPALAGMVEGLGRSDKAPESVVAGLEATLTGLPVWTGQRRLDPAGLPGTINIVLAKSDAAALGIHGVGLQRIAADGSVGSWQFHTFADPQSPLTRSAVMDLVGQQITVAMKEFVRISPIAQGPIHLVLPDAATGWRARNGSGASVEDRASGREFPSGGGPGTSDEPALAAHRPSRRARLAHHPWWPIVRKR